MRSLLDGIASRLDESRELSRYMTGLLIFLGLLGTFWGLLKTIGAVSDVIGAMSVGSRRLNALFEQLKSGLAKPLAGMGTAFSASMFGLSGALVLGFLDLTAGQAQNRFFNELEEWLAGLTRLSSGVLAEGEGSVPVYVQALLEQTAENMENLQRILLRGEEGRAQANQAVMALTEQHRDAVGHDAHQPATHAAHRRGAGGAGPALQRLAEQRRDSGVDDVARGHLRNIELYLQRLLAEAEQGRAQSTAELRNDLRILTRTVAALAEEQQVAAMAADRAPARRQRAGRLARLRGRAVHAADGHHLRAAGVRAGAGVPVGGADRARQAARPGEPAACRGHRHAVAGARPQRRPAAVDRAAQSRACRGHRRARHAVAAACGAEGSGRARQRRSRHAARGTRPAGAAAGRRQFAGTLRRGTGGAVAE